MDLNDTALQAAYAAVPAQARDMNTIAVAIRAYVDAAMAEVFPSSSTVRAMESALSALRVIGIDSVTATPIALLSEELARANAA
jgi:hypothetical protein